MDSKFYFRLIVFTLLGLVNAQWAAAQSVEISANNGSLIHALTYDNESGWAAGFCAMWRHEQLALTMTTSDGDEVTASGEIADPSAALGTYDGNLVIVGGHMPTFLVISLPNGYRFDGYEMVLVNNLGGKDVCENANPRYSEYHALPMANNKIMQFYETVPWTTGSTNASSQYNNLDPVIETLAQAKDANENGNIVMSRDNQGTEYTISRTRQGDNMGNQLYFRLTKNDFFYGLTIKSLKLFFTAEGTFTTAVSPRVVSTTPVSMLPIPFETNKIDIGDMQDRTKDNVTYYSYDHNNVQDLLAYNYLYQEDAVEDGVPADVATTPKIYQMYNGGKSYFGLKNGLYYLETPVEITNSSSNPAPIGYRIVGARINYAYGVDTEASHQDATTTHYITYTSDGTTYYLGSSARFGTSPVEWEITSQGYVHIGNTYLVMSNRGNLGTGNQNSGRQVRADENGHLYYTEGQGYWSTTYYLHGTTSGSTAPTFSTDTNNLAVWETINTPAQDIPAFVAEEYQIQFYDREGNKIPEDEGGLVTVNASTPADASFDDFGGLLNNDAIMFEIKGVDSGMALVNVDLDLQALDPYIDKMDIVCTDENEVLKLTQSFTADNFSVSGGKFIFYVPEDYEDDLLTFTFSDLYSKYGDATYYEGDGEGFSRYSFVTSDYFLDKIDGNGNNGLYDDEYSPNTNYTTKISTSTAGKYRFKFNNAEDLTGGEGSVQGASLEEYPFSVYTYLHTKNPGDKTASPPIASSNDLGKFIGCQLQANLQDQKSGTYYVFTADETRYNIAKKTTAWQHRFYAFYRMEIELRAKTFTPDFTWEKIYPATLYDKDGTDAEDSMWGLTLDTSDTETIDGEEVKVDGYLTYQEIINNIQGREGVKFTQEEIDAAEEGDPAYGKTTNDWKIKPIAKRLDDTNTNAPASMKQILYIDGSPLHAMINSSQGEDIIELKDLQPLLNVNALVYLPENTTSTEKNAAYKSSAGLFHTGGDVVLTDKQPFYSKYDIHVDATKKATYTRLLTRPDYGQETNATVMLPFTLAVTNGKHTNSQCSFTVNTMVAGKKMSTNGTGSTVDYGTAYFAPISGKTSEANKPYMIHVESVEESTDGETFSFVAQQTGAFIPKTPEPAATPTGECEEKDAQGHVGTITPIFSGKLIMGETAQAEYSDKDYYFTNYATYSGGKFDRAVSEDVFYFSKNKYVDLHTLYPNTERYLRNYPFRAVYTYSISAPTTTPSVAKPMKGFYISYNLDEMEDAGFATRLEQLGTKADMMIRSGKGFITITATADQKFTIRTLNGMTVKNVGVNAGNTTTVNLPAGIYLVNNTKITVK